MTKIILILLVIISVFTSHSQENHNIKNIGEFEQAISFDISNNGEFFVIDAGDNSLIKLDSFGRRILSIGGFGWQASTFDNPIDVKINNLRVYVADKNNHRIQLFDRELNFIGVIKSDPELDVSFSYPSCVDVSNQGDLFILDSESERIFKFDSFGNLMTIIGDYDAGEYILQSPVDIALTSTNLLFVLCSDKIFIYDIFGNGIKIIDLDYEPANLFISEEYILTASENEVKFALVEDNNNIFQTIYNVRDGVQIQDIYYIKNTLYLLTPETILTVPVIPDNIK